MNMEQLENVEKKARKLIPSSNEVRKDRLRTLNLLHFSQYMELHDGQLNDVHWYHQQ